jgi:hypothetical protein
MTRSIRVNEAYRNWTPPDWVRPAVCQILERVDGRYLTGLDTVVLTNAGALNSQRKRGKTWSRRHKVYFVDCRALYHARHQGQGAWIEMFVDKIFERAKPWVLNVPPLRDLYLADTLFHELGHHIHSTQVPEYRNREDVADAWRNRLVQQMFRTRHPLIYVATRLPGRRLFRSQKTNEGSVVSASRRSAT